jgi:hypothetical protein
MTKQLDLSNATVNELLVLTEMLLEVIVEAADIDLAGTVINLTVNKPGEDPRVVAQVTGQTICDRIATMIEETA